MTTPEPPVARGLWRERGFPAFWIGQSFAQLGTQFAVLALPIVAVKILHATDAEMGYLAAAEFAAFLIIGLPAGAWLDRMRKRHVMIVADLVRAAAVLAIPALHLLGLLEVWHLFVVGAIVGTATVFFDVGYQSFVPVLVKDQYVGSANGALEASAQTMRLAGPALAGLLLRIVSAPLLLVLNAIGFVASAVSLMFVRDHEQQRPPAPDRSLVREIGEGLSFVFRTELLTRIVITTALTNLGSTMIFTLMPIVLLRMLGFDDALFGIVLATQALGGLIGSVFAAPIARRIGEGQALAASTIVFGVVGASLPIAALIPEFAVPIVLVGNVLIGVSVLVYNVIQVTARQRMCPTPLLGRMNASIRFVVWGVMPIGALAAGSIGEHFGTLVAVWIGVAVAALGAVPVTFSRFARMRSLPVRPGAPETPPAASG